MEPTSTVSSPVDVPARLSPAQKRDLVGQGVAAIVTTALIAAPLISSRTVVLPAQSFAGPVTAVAIAEARTPATTLRAPSVALDTPARRLAPEMRRSSARKPLSRRLTGWLVGDGSQTIRPFPAIVSSRP